MWGREGPGVVSEPVADATYRLDAVGLSLSGCGNEIKPCTCLTVRGTSVRISHGQTDSVSRGRARGPMEYHPDKHHRRSVRLKGHDYTQPWAYFVTICTYQRECLLGHIDNGNVVLSAAGMIARSVWDGLPERFPSVGIDEHVIMPNHVHGIILVGAQFIAPDAKDAPTDDTPRLGEIIRAYKATVTRLVRRRDDGATDKGVMNHAPTGFAWQRGYYEHVVRTEAELTAIREYILANPARWDEDENNPLLLDNRGE